MEQDVTCARIDLLLELSDVAQRASDLADVYEHALHAATLGLGTDRGSILLFDEHGRMRFRASRGLSEEYRKAVDGHSPWTAAATSPPPVIVADAEVDPAWDAYRALFRAEGIGALAFFPLMGHARLLGKLTVYFAQPRIFADSDVAWAKLVSHVTAQAISVHHAETERLRSVEESRHARQLAERVEQNRADLLALTVHDLRNPINTLKLSLSMLSRSPSFPADEKVVRQVDRMGRSVSSMERFLDCLSDVLSIEGGRLQVHLVDEALTSIIERVLQELAPRAAERSQSLEVDVPLGLRVRADRGRLAEALTHLLSDAMRATPAQGRIRLCGKRITATGAPMVEVAVIASRPGLGVAEFPQILEASPGRGPGASGAELRLLVVKGIVEAHGGSFVVESQPGGDSLFRITLRSAD